MVSLAGKSIAYLGMGIMGSAMAANLARAGAIVVGWNRSAGKPGIETASQSGVTFASDLGTAVKGAEIIFSCLGDEQDVLQVLGEDVARQARANALVVDTTTIGPSAARQVAQSLSRHHLRFLDAPVTGGDIGARQGTLTLLVGGEEADFLECKPAFEAVGKRIFHCGPVGSGQAMKLCNQILCAVNMVAVSEALALADELGLSEELLIESLSEGAGGSWALANLGARITRGDFAPGFMLTHMLKDLRLVAENAGSAKPLPGTDLARGLFEQAAAMPVDSGLSDRQGTQSMFRVYKERLSASSPRRKP